MGKEGVDIVIDLAFNFLTDKAGDKIKNTKFSGPIKEAFQAAGVDINGFLKDFLNNKDKTSEQTDVQSGEKLIENDATKVKMNYKLVKKDE